MSPALFNRQKAIPKEEKVKKALLLSFVMGMIVSVSWAADITRSTNSAELTQDEADINNLAWRANLVLLDTAFLKEQQTLLGDMTIPVGGYGGPSFMFTTVNNQFSMMMGGGGGMLLWHRLILGGMGAGMTTAIPVSHISGATTNSGNLTVGYGGFMLGYIFFPESLVHFSLYGVIGGGAVMITPSTVNGIVIDPNAKQTIFPFGSYMIGADVELNIGKMLRVKVGGGYRIVSGVDTYNISGVTDSSLSGAYGALSISMGCF